METLTKLFESRLDAFLERTGLRPSTFGLEATGDPNLIGQLHLGRSPRLVTADQILAFMEAYDQAQVEPCFLPGQPAPGFFPERTERQSDDKSHRTRTALSCRFSNHYLKKLQAGAAASDRQPEATGGGRVPGVEPDWSRCTLTK